MHPHLHTNKTAQRAAPIARSLPWLPGKNVSADGDATTMSSASSLSSVYQDALAQTATRASQRAARLAGYASAEAVGDAPERRARKIGQGDEAHAGLRAEEGH
jgi:hypothetical protein